jgi:hypothetical protein
MLLFKHRMDHAARSQAPSTPDIVLCCQGTPILCMLSAAVELQVTGAFACTWLPGMN